MTEAVTAPASDKASGPERVLDLQQLYGEEPQPVVIVAPSGRRYVLRGRREMGPREIVLLGKVQRRLNEMGPLDNSAEELTKGQDQQLQSLATETLKMLCPELVEEEKLCFLDKLAILQFYQQKMLPERPESPPAAAA